MTMKKIVITRHPALVEYLKATGMVPENVEVLEHATPEVVEGHHVFGVLPHCLSCLTNLYTAIPLNIPAELRGQELTLEGMYKYAGKPETYSVNRLS